MLSDIEIAQQSKMLPITQVAAEIGLNADDLELYGKYKAKLSMDILRHLPNHHGKLILVTSINPTPAGEGKSTVSIGLADALRKQLHQKTMLTLREPSLGPVMGIKGGATGGGYAQVVPMEDINLHFTGDIHALTAANNTLAALIDNHLQQGNSLGIDPRRILWKRVLDINDRALRNVVIGLGGPKQGVPRQDGFDITVASELMAVLCLATNLADLKQRIDHIVVGYTYDEQPVTVHDLGVAGAITMLLKDAIKPNLVQTLEHTPTLIHGGPFANIAHGCNSILATQTALHLADYTVTEAGFGADLGAEKFMDIVTPHLGQAPDAVVIVATVRALKYNAGLALRDLQIPNVTAVKNGFTNLHRHIINMQKYGMPVVVAINQFDSDSSDEINTIISLCQALHVTAVPTNIWREGSRGGQQLAQAVLTATQTTHQFKPLYQHEMDVKTKINTIVTQIYGGNGVEYSAQAQKAVRLIKQNGWEHLPICMAKTQYSFSDDAHLLGAPRDFKIHVRDIVPRLGAGFLVVMTGNVLTMPGLPKQLAALKMDIDENGKISGLF